MSFEQIKAESAALTPAQRRELIEFEGRTDDGRLLNGFIRYGIAILYWIDFADRHVKVLALTRAD